MREIEKKYLVKFKPDNLEKYQKVGIRQWYITKEDDSVINRLRLYDTGECIFEFKKGHHMFRDEIAFHANFKEFEKLIEWAPNLYKERYIILNDEKFHITLDVYKEQLEGLLILEVEGKGNDAFNDIFNYEIPEEWDWIGEEISDNIDYSNVKLAKKNMIKPKNFDNLYKIINEVITEEAREEAIEIAKLMDDEQYSEIKLYYDTLSYNIVCSSFDKIKYDLSKEGKITINKNDYFGHLPSEFMVE